VNEQKRKEMVDGIISKQIPLYSASIHEQGRAGEINLDETQMAALRLQWRDGQDELETFIVFSSDLVDEMSPQEHADLYYEAALRHLKKRYAA
jgi:hypothetical protein